MEVKVILCDRCRRIIASGKCIVCGRDVCNECSKSLSVRAGSEVHLLILTTEYFDKTNVRICKDCFRKIRDGISEISKSRSSSSRVVKAIIDIIRDEIIAFRV